MTDALLEVRNLRVEYDVPRSFMRKRGSLVAADGVSFSIQAGQTFGLVGESGSGKSTVGSAILRMVQPSSGSIHFEGEDISSFGKNTPLRYRRDVQVVFQDPLASFDARWSIQKSLEEAIRCHRNLSKGEMRVEISRLLGLVELSTFHGNRLPTELSGGQRQRAAIARALAVNPKLIVCDEAVSALDTSTQNQIINLFHDLQAEFGLSYLFIAHDLDLVETLSDVIGVMNRGRLVEVGAAKEVYGSPQNDYTKKLLASVLVADPDRKKVTSGVTLE